MLATRSGQSSEAGRCAVAYRANGREGDGNLNHGRTRSPHVSRIEFEAVDLGNEPPLFADGRSYAVADRRRVSVRWFVGTVLTGLSGAALMGGAVYAALDREANFAAIPERVEAALRGTLGGER